MFNRSDLEETAIKAKDMSMRKLSRKLVKYLNRRMPKSAKKGFKGDK